ncbi:MAG: hypothetical protein JW809_12595 [Pirellulales bacterium]|nr:hypothetical protein [Pirellulales bacterium]
MTDVDSDVLETLKRNGSFFVSVYPQCPHGVDTRKRLPPHRLVIEPLIAQTHEMRIYGWDNTSVLCDEVLSLGKRKRGHIEADLSREVVKGHERFWNTGTWERGAIVLATAVTEEDIGSLFYWCSGPHVWSSLHQMRKGTPMSAIRYAQAVAAAGSTAFCFSASNGIEWMDVFADDIALGHLFAIAQERCRPFKRYVEHNPGRDEIIVDRSPYTDML